MLDVECVSFVVFGRCEKTRDVVGAMRLACGGVDQVGWSAPKVKRNAARNVVRKAFALGVEEEQCRGARGRVGEEAFFSSRHVQASKVRLNPVPAARSCTRGHDPAVCKYKKQIIRCGQDESIFKANALPRGGWNIDGKVKANSGHPKGKFAGNEV